MLFSRRLHGVSALLTAGLMTAGLALPAVGEGDIASGGQVDCSAEAAALEFAREMMERQGMDPEMVDVALAMACSDGEMATRDGALPSLEDGIGQQSISSEPVKVTLDLVEDLLIAQGTPPEQVEQVLAMVEQMAHIGGGGGAGKVNASGDDGTLTDQISLNFVTEMLEAQGMSPEQIEQLMILGLSGGAGTLDEEGKAVVINHEEQYDPDAGGGLTLEALDDPTRQDAGDIDVARDPAGTVEAAIAAAAAQRGLDPAVLQQMTLEEILDLLAE